MAKERLEKTFAALAAKNETALITYITAGDPSLEQTKLLVETLVAGGADIIELGVPFSDPLADGPTIQKAALRSLKIGTTLKKVLDLVTELRADRNSLASQIPIVLLLYCNTIFSHGEDRFPADAVAAGVDGIVVPDLPPEEGTALRREARRNGLAVIPLVAPTTPPARLKTLVAEGSGFIYYVSVRGVTGAREHLAPDLAENIARIRRASSLPIAVGFGVSKPEHAVQIGRLAEGIIVGSAIVRIIEEYSGEEILGKVRKFAGELKAGLKERTI
ncbi:MAG: tryptophan synthase subunit alpha [Firmicutes bacterium]|nr:tryptophan synthase subunit alpha [Bacillota bacterium]